MWVSPCASHNHVEADTSMHNIITAAFNMRQYTCRGMSSNYHKMYFRKVYWIYFVLCNIQCLIFGQPTLAILWAVSRLRCYACVSSTYIRWDHVHYVYGDGGNVDGVILVGMR